MRSRNRCRIVWRNLDGETVHDTETDTTSAMIYRRWVRDGTIEGYTIEVLPPGGEDDESE